MQNDQKQQLRQQMKAKRDQIPDAERKRAARAVASLADQLLGLDEEIESVSLYYSVRGELNCLPLATALAKRGVETSIPFVEEGGKPLSFYPWTPDDPVETGAYAIPIPADRRLSVLPDLVIMPLLGFDQQGHRLGYGGGYYDRSLEAMRQIFPVSAVGLAFELQECTNLPVESHDQPLDFVLTPAGLRKF